MSMRTMVKSFPLSLSAVRSAVLKPAVRGVTDWNAAMRICWDVGTPAKAWSCSRMKKATVPSTSAISVPVNAILLCSRHFEKRKRWVRISSQTKKPRPPHTTSAIRTIFKSGSPATVVRDVPVPNRSNPALQKADTAWNTDIQTPRKP